METLRIAATALRANKLRSFLTLLGVIIGVMTIISVISVIAGLNQYITEKVFSLNPDVFIVTKFGIITDRDEFLAAIRRKSITAADIRAVEERCAHCGLIGYGAQSRQTVKRNARHLSGVELYGSTSNLAALYNIDVEVGRFFTLAEEQHSVPVAVIGTDVRDELFGALDPIGREVTLAGRKLRVIGVLKKRGSVLGQNQDSVLYFPFGQFRKLYGGRGSLDIFIRPANGLDEMAQAQDDVRSIIRARRHTSFRAGDPFGMVTAEALQTLWKGISASAFAFMMFISGISLVVGGIVIMNIMLVSVIERTREIGVRRALGARGRDILLQFLTEAILLAAIGGSIGILIGYGIGKGLSAAFELPTLLRPSAVVAALVVATLTGVLAGFFPARRASRLPPVDALRFE